MMSIVDSISSITMDTPIATIFTFDWTTDIIVSVVELVIVLREVGDKFVAAEFDINIVVGSSSIKFKLGYAAYYYIILLILTCIQHCKFYFSSSIITILSGLCTWRRTVNHG